jgi:transcriptional regulator with XRE-family HTH domain
VNTRSRPAGAILLIDARKERGLSQARLAKNLGVSASLIGMIESGKSRPSPELAYQLERDLRVPFRIWFDPELALAAGGAR